MSPSDPIYQPLIALESFLQPFLAKPYMAGSRNFRLFEAIRDHIPKPTDTPKQQQDKLNVIKQNMLGMAQEMKIEAPAVYGGPTLPPPPSAQPQAASSGKTVTQAQIQQYASEHNIDATTASRVFTDAGYAVQ